MNRVSRRAWVRLPYAELLKQCWVMLEFDRIGVRRLGLVHHVVGDLHVAQRVVATLGDDENGTAAADKAAVDLNIPT